MVRFARFLDEYLIWLFCLEVPQKIFSAKKFFGHTQPMIREWWSKFGIRKNGSHLHKFSIMINFGIKVCNKKEEILATCKPFSFFGGGGFVFDNR